VIASPARNTTVAFVRTLWAMVSLVATKVSSACADTTLGNKMPINKENVALFLMFCKVKRVPPVEPV